MNTPARSHSRRPLTVRFCCLLSLLALASLCAVASPVGNWDCVIKGRELGVAQIFFYADGTLEGRAVFAFAGKTTGTNISTNLFGGAYLQGRWSYENPARTERIIGFINRISSRAGTTLLQTNGLSFRGTVRGTRLSLTANGSQGLVTFRGIPLEDLEDLPPTFYANGQRPGGVPFVEIFDLSRPSPIEYLTNTVITPFDCSTTNIVITTNSVPGSNFVTITERITITQRVCFTTNITITPIVNESVENFYLVEGAGAAYQYTGRLLISRQNYAAFFQGRGENNQLITVYVGRFDPATGRGTLSGTDGGSRNIRLTIHPGGP